MANGAPDPRKQKLPGAVAAAAGVSGARQEFNADERSSAREETPVVIGGVTFTRRRKAWKVSRAMRGAMREQEKAVALAHRLRRRIVELEAEQTEAAIKGNTERDSELETMIDQLIEQSDASTMDAELATYRLLTILLVPPATVDGEVMAKLEADFDVDWPEAAQGFGPLDGEENAKARRQAAVDFLLPLLDVEDAIALAQELTGSDAPDPQETPSSESGSS